MMPLRRIAAPLVALLCAGSPAAAHRRADPLATGLPAIRYTQHAPDFTFARPSGPEHLAALAGRPVVLTFWASWCEPCRSEIGALAELGRTYGDGVTVVAVSEDRSPGVAEAYLMENDVRAISVEDPERKIFALYSVVPNPTTLVLAPDGSVSHVSIGALDWDELRAAVDRVRQTGLTLPGAFGTVSGNAGTPDR